MCQAWLNFTKKSSRVQPTGKPIFIFSFHFYFLFVFFNLPCLLFLRINGLFHSLLLFFILQLCFLIWLILFIYCFFTLFAFLFFPLFFLIFLFILFVLSILFFFEQNVFKFLFIVLAAYYPMRVFELLLKLFIVFY